VSANSGDNALFAFALTFQVNSSSIIGNRDNSLVTLEESPNGDLATGDLF